MIDKKDFSYKHIIMVFSLEGDKLSFSNDNLLVTKEDGKVKLEVSLYNIFTIFIVGDLSITTTLIRKIEAYHISIVLATSSFKVYEIICNHNLGNTLLRKKQYEYDSMDLSKAIIENKIKNQIMTIDKIRDSSEDKKRIKNIIVDQLNKIELCNNTQELMGVEGMASRIYFNYIFNGLNWIRRVPRVKSDYINASLDIGYTILFNLIDALLELFGFDTFQGIHHKQYYMRKSLVCDIVEPFRCIVDYQVRRSIRLCQFKEKDFVIKNHQYQLKWEKSIEYTKVFIDSLVKYKEQMFSYIQSYYRFFMNKKSINKYQMFLIGE